MANMYLKSICFIVCILCILCICPASGYWLTFEDPDEEVLSYSGYNYMSIGSDGTGLSENNRLTVSVTGSTANFVVLESPLETFDYLALTHLTSSTNPWGDNVFLVTGGMSGYPNGIYTSSTTPKPSRYELINGGGGTWNVYREGVYVSSHVGPGVDTFWKAYGSNDAHGSWGTFDDIVATTHESVVWQINMHPFYKDYYFMYSDGAYSSGSYSNATNSKLSNDFSFKWFRPSVGYKGDLRTADKVEVVHFQTGEVVYTFDLNTEKIWGWETFSIQDVFVNTSAPYGQYWFKLYRSDGKFMDGEFIAYTSTPIGGHTIEWDKTRYYTTDTAKITSTLASLDPAYEYSGKIFDIYGANHGTWSIPTTSHTETIAITNWDTGVYYASISLKEKSTGEEFDIAFTPMEIFEGVGFKGTTLDVVSGDPASNTSVTLTQAGSPKNTESDIDGKYIVDDLVQNYPVTFNANKTGYVHYDWIYTPLQARSYDFDLYLYPDPLFSDPSTPAWTGNNGTAVAGFVHKAHNKQPLESALVELTIDNVTSTTYTYATGFYSFDDLTPDLNYSLNVYSAGYTNTSASGTLGNGTMTTHNFQLNGMSSLYGRVHNADTYQAIAGATVTATIGGSSYNTTSSSTGYYIIHDVPANTGYSVQATKTGFKPSDAKTGTLSDGNPTLQEIPMEGEYTLTVHFLDAKDRTIIGGEFTVYLDTGAETTASGGKAYFYNLEKGTYFVQTASSESHYGSNTMVVVEGDTDKTVYLQRITQASDSPAYGSQYPPHMVKFEVRTYAGAAISNATILAKGGEVSFGVVDWLQGLFGLKIDETPIHNETMNATTDSYGIANFLMIPVIKYDINITKDGEVLKEFNVYPKDDYYLILVGDTLWRDPSKDPLAVVTTSVSLIDKDGIISVKYLDINDDTSSVVMSVYQRSSANKTEKVLVDNHTISASSNFTYNFTMTDFARQSYYVEIDASHGTLGDIERLYGVTFGGVRIPIGDIPSEMYIWIALGILMLTGCIFGATSAVAGAVVVCFMGWVLLAFGWLDDLGLGAPLSLSAATVIAVVGVLQKRYREEGFN